MSHKVGNILNDFCSIIRCGDKLTVYPRNYLEGIQLSDDRMNVLFQVYAQLLADEQSERTKNET